jgi:RNA recognition motif-containing protein
MSTKLYVGNMSYDASEQDLEQLFAQYGEVQSATIIMDRYTDRPKGFGFVEMESAETCQAAIDALNENEWMGRKLVVNIARPRQERLDTSSLELNIKASSQGCWLFLCLILQLILINIQLGLKFRNALETNEPQEPPQ